MLPVSDIACFSYSVIWNTPNFWVWIHLFILNVSYEFIFVTQFDLECYSISFRLRFWYSHEIGNVYPIDTFVQCYFQTVMKSNLPLLILKTNISSYTWFLLNIELKNAYCLFSHNIIISVRCRKRYVFPSNFQS